MKDNDMKYMVVSSVMTFNDGSQLINPSVVSTDPLSVAFLVEDYEHELKQILKLSKEDYLRLSADKATRLAKMSNVSDEELSSLIKTDQEDAGEYYDNFHDTSDGRSVVDAGIILDQYDTFDELAQFLADQHIPAHGIVMPSLKNALNTFHEMSIKKPFIDPRGFEGDGEFDGPTPYVIMMERLRTVGMLASIMSQFNRGDEGNDPLGGLFH